jgi:hypothetical protein
LFSEHGQGYQALSDRGDIGGLSTAVGFDGLPSVFVCDGYPGRAGLCRVRLPASPHLVGCGGRGHSGL